MVYQDKLGPEIPIRKKFEFLEIHRCPEGAKIGFKQLIVEFGDLIVPFLSGWP